MRPQPSILARWFIGRLSSKASADAILSDIGEIAGPNRWRLEREAWAYIASLTGLAVGRWLAVGQLVLRDATRSLRTTPRITGVMFVILALTITAATVTFSVVDAVVLRPLPFDQDHELVSVGIVSGTPSLRIGIAAFEADTWRQLVPAFSGLGLLLLPSEQTLPGLPRPVLQVRSSADLLPVLGVGVFRGRMFTVDDERAGAPPVAIIGHALWTQAFGADDQVLGRTLGSEPGAPRIVGVLPPGVVAPAGTGDVIDVWRPLQIPADDRLLVSPGLTRMYHAVARLRGSVSIETARSAVESATAPVRQLRPEGYVDARVEVMPLRDAMVGDVKPLLLLAICAVLLTTAVACVNAANLALTRGLVRGREFALRASLGAGRGALVATLITEGVLLAAAASMVALLVSAAVIGSLRAALPADLALAGGIAVNGRVFAFAVIAAFVSGLGFAVVPALQASRVDLAAVLKAGSLTVTPARRRWQHGFLIGQVAGLMVLLVAAVLLAASFVRVVRTDLGFGRDGLVVAPLFGFRGTTAEAEATFAAVPGVEAVALIAGGGPPLLQFGSSTTRLTPEGESGPEVGAEFRRVTPSYFAATATPMLRGRTFEPGETFGQAIVVDASAAHALFGTLDAVGRLVKMAGGKPMPVVGVVANVRLRGPENSTGPQAYVPLTGTGGALLVARAAGDPRPVAAELRTRLARDVPMALQERSVEVLADTFATLTAHRRVASVAMLLFAVLGLAIGVGGVFGVVSAQVAQRTREFGIRRAIGAPSAAVLALVLGGAGRSVGIGVLLGAPIAALVARQFERVLYATSPVDPAIYLGAAAALILAGLTAAALPARRAARVDPLTILRTE